MAPENARETSAEDPGASNIHAFLSQSRAREESRGLELRTWSRILSFSRLVVFLLFLVFLWLVFGAGRWLWPSLIFPAMTFFVLLALHERLHRRLLGNQFRLALHDWSIARVENRWHGQGVPGIGLLGPDHPYAADLDIVGVGSLFESVCIARTNLGQRFLADWIGFPGETAEVVLRQAAVRELASDFSSRLELAEKSGNLSSGKDLGATVRWASARIQGPSALWVPVAFVLGIANLVTLVQWISGGADSVGVGVCALATMGLYGLTWNSIRQATAGLEKQTEALLAARGGLAAMGAHPPWKSERLLQLTAELKKNGTRPSAETAVDRLVTLVQAWQAKRNPLITLPLILLFWDLIFAWLLARWHARNAPALGKWLDALGEYEALQCLGHQSFLFPCDIFPKLLDQGPPCLLATDLGHPLLPLNLCIRNRVELGPPRQLLLISGSNMSGKSTYLRTVGISAVLAWAGAPVRATSMEISRFQVAAILHAEDSLRLGMSRFAAELARMRKLIELSKDHLPLLFLLDEIFSGTNSSDRLAGAEALIARLVQSGAVGMVTTHDLTLARIADDLGEKGANVHFVDSWSGGMMSFDYRLQPGVVPRSNALGLMRAIGLEI